MSALPSTLAETDDTLRLGDLARIVSKHRRTARAAFALVLVPGALAALAQRSVYRATSMLQIDPNKPNVANVQELYPQNPVGLPLTDYYRTQFEILRSRRVVEPVARALQAKGARPLRDVADPAEALLASLTVEPVRDSRLVRVSVESTDAAFAADATNGVVDQFLEDSGHRLVGLGDAGLKRLREMESELRPKHEAAARALQLFKEQNDIFSLDESQSSAAQRLKTLSDELTRAKTERARLTAELRTLERAVERNLPGKLPPELAGSRLMEELKLELAKTTQERDELVRRYGPEHPRLRGLEKRVASCEARIADERRAVLESVATRLAQAAEEEKELAAAVSAAQDTVSDLGRKAIRLQFLKGEAEIAETSYRNVAKRVEEVELATATGGRADNMFVVDRALAASRPVRPKRALDLAIAAVLALVAALGASFAHHALAGDGAGRASAGASIAARTPGRTATTGTVAGPPPLRAPARQTAATRSAALEDVPDEADPLEGITSEDEILVLLDEQEARLLASTPQLPPKPAPQRREAPVANPRAVRPVLAHVPRRKVTG